ncbi:MogA/MoaB family molybdenum cofactor biosynthesis protein [Longivirga aurantiaca]|uniref:Molybdenum cofactor biosynthesis protein B n=1 Tax=Longivirga aurantiaca TaxID=1837743 RepID=A0ABW1SWD9_9ACTN
MRALVITISTRAAAGVYEDVSGPVLVAGLEALGFDVAGPTVVPDGPEIESVLLGAVHDRFDVVLTTGGTGLTPNDVTPEHTARVITREAPGIAEAIRAAGVAKGVPTAALSRGRAGLAGETLIVNLPGSKGGVKDGMAVLSELLVHAVEQIRGGDHPRTDDGAA